MLRVLCGYFEHQRRVQFEGCVVEPPQTITGILPGSKLGCLLLRIVLQDALSDVTSMFLPLKLRVFVDDITAIVIGRNKEVVEMAENVLKKFKREVDGKGLQLLIAEGGKEGKSKVITSCRYGRSCFRCAARKKEWFWRRVSTMQGVDLENENQAAGSGRKVETKEVRGQILANKKGSSRKLHEKWVRKLLRTGLGLARAWRGQAVGIAPTEMLRLRRHMVAAAGKKELVSLSIFIEVTNLDVEEELSTMATLAWAEGTWMGRWARKQSLGEGTFLKFRRGEE